MGIRIKLRRFPGGNTSVAAESGSGLPVAEDTEQVAVSGGRTVSGIDCSDS